MMRKNKYLFINLIPLTTIFTITFITIALISPSSPAAAANWLAVHFLNVGQADSILLELPDGQSMLIDAGNSADGPLIVNYLKCRGIVKIDYLIGTHPHEDHIGGLEDIINAFTIGQVYIPPVVHNSEIFVDILQTFQVGGRKITPARAGVRIIDQAGLKAYFLSPSRDNYAELNQWSAVLKVVYGETSFLFTGDAEETNETDMMAAQVRELDVDLLKVGHHGSDSSTSAAFVEAVSPLYAVISVGEGNSYGHPSPVVIDRLKKFGALVLRTDQLGTIIARSSGYSIKLYRVVERYEVGKP